MDFCRRTQAALDNPNFLTDPSERQHYIAAIKQNELQTLQDMYEPKVKGGKANEFKSSNPSVAAFAKELKIRRKGFQDTGRAVHGSALQEVEQEREVAFEVEAVRQVKKPVRSDPLSFPGLHRDIEIFARTGRLPVDSYAIQPVFRLLSRTFLGGKYRVAAKGCHLESRLYVSAEFGKTVKYCAELSRDTFLVSNGIVYMHTLCYRCLQFFLCYYSAPSTGFSGAMPTKPRSSSFPKKPS
jgi:hypothetical protein